MIAHSRTVLAALLLAGVALGPRCATTGGTPHPDPRPADGETEKASLHGSGEPEKASHPEPIAANGERVDTFQSSVRPVLSTRCAPCHEVGGKMHARLPFDDAKTVSTNSAAILRRLKGDDRAALERWVEGLAAATPAR